LIVGIGILSTGPVSWAQLTAGLILSQSTTAHARSNYLSRCAEFTRGLIVKPEYGTTRNATQCLGQLRKKRMPSFIVLSLFFVLTTRSYVLRETLFLVQFLSYRPMTIVAGVHVFKFKHCDAILKDNK